MMRFATMLAGLWALVAVTIAPATLAADDTESAGLQPIDSIVAVVNDAVILRSELEAGIARTRNRLGREGSDVPPRDVLRKRVLDKLIDRRLQVERAKRRGITVDDSQVNAALRRIAQERGTDLAGLRERFSRKSRSFDHLRQTVRDRLLISRLRQRAVASQIQVSDQEVADFVDRIEQASKQRTEYRLRHILIELPAEPSSQEVTAARKQARGIIQRLRGGADFASLATRVSAGPRALEGGDLGWRSRAQLPSLFLDTIKGIGQGEIAGPVRSPNGFHILKLVDRRGGASRTITQYKARHILLRNEGDGSARSQLSRLRRRLREGEADFSTLAQAQSDHARSASKGGRLGWVGPGDMPPAFIRVLQGMSVGDVSEPFRSPMGWHLVKLTDRRERTDIEAYRRAQARRTLYRRKLQQETQQWLRKLRSNAFIDKRLDG